jgi:hypothetical protein
MKTKLHLLRLTVLTVLLGFQYGIAQTGGAFNGVTPSIGHLTIIEFENFDLGSNADTSIGGSAPFGYSDKSPGNVTVATSTIASSSYRTATSPDADIVELVADNTFKYVGSTQGGEFFYYSITVGTTGTYHIDVNYAHGSGTNKRIKIERLDTVLTGAVVLVDGTSDLANALPKTANASTFATNSAGPVGNPFQFDLEAGKSYVIKFTINDAGPNYNWFQFVRDGDATLSTNSFEKGNNTLEVYPNPATDGQFQLNIETKWDVYTVLGQKVLTGEGKNVNLSSLTKGVYLLKTPFASKRLVSK